MPAGRSRETLRLRLGHDRLRPRLLLDHLPRPLRPAHHLQLFGMHLPLPQGPPAMTPLGAWDTCEPLWWQHHAEASPWAQEHIPDLDRTYRAEFYLIDAPFAVLYRYAENEAG